LECDIEEEKKKINNDWFYELLQKNKDMFNYEIEVEKKEEKTVGKWKSNEKDLIKIINFLLKNKLFLEHEKTYIKTFLDAMQKWIVWRNTIRQVKSFLEQNLEKNNTTYIVSNLKELIPEEYLNTPKNNPTSSNTTKIEVILSEYFI
jgi:hypothetical protein